MKPKPKEPPAMQRWKFKGVWMLTCGHHRYEWSDVRRCCLACERIKENHTHA